MSGLNRPDATLAVPLSNYIETLTTLVAGEVDTTEPTDAVANWFARFAILKRRQRAYGKIDVLSHWLRARRMRPLELPIAS